MNHYTADTHAYHANIICYCKRPYLSVEEMNQSLADNINATVERNDTLLHLGDFSWGPQRDLRQQLKNARTFRSMLNCKHIILIFGNHDNLRHSVEFRRLFSKTADLLEFKDRIVNEKVVLCHYALRTWNAAHYGRWHLFGHSHGSLPDNNSFSFDVGVDAQGYKPLSSLEVQIIMQIKEEEGAKASIHHHEKDN